MNEELRELAALAALGALDPSDAERLAAAVAADPDLARELALDQAVVGELGRFAARSTPRAGLGDQILAAAVTGAKPGRSSRSSAGRRPVRRFIPAAGVAVAAALLASLVTFVATRGDSGLGAPVATAAIAPHSSATPISGTASLFHTDAPDGRIVLDLAKVTPAPTGHHYEIWVLRKGATTMEAVGAFAPATTSLKLTLPLPGKGDYGAVDISLQPDGGPPEHSQISVAGGAFTPGTT